VSHTRGISGPAPEDRQRRDVHGLTVGALVSGQVGAQVAGIQTVDLGEPVKV
jgi:hypothetical protein